jgi:alpha-glucosidase
VSDGARAAGPVRRAWIDGCTANVDFTGSLLSITVHGDDFVRVRFTPGAELRPRRSWSVVPPDDELAADALSLSRGRDTVQIAGHSLRVTVGCHGAVAVTTADGAPVAPGALCDGPTWDGASLKWTGEMADGVRYYGFGERTGLLDKRGRRYTSWTTDRYDEQGPGSDTLYQAIPFVVAVDPIGATHGVFLNSTWRSAFDLTALHTRRFVVETEGPELDVFLIVGPEPGDVLERYTRLTGRIPLPPRWALGYHQARWSYASESAVRDVAAELRSRRIPADVIGLDIDHMDGYRVFTWDPAAFPDPAALVADLRTHGFRAVAIVDCGVKEEPGYAVYDEGAAHGYFFTCRDGTPFRGYVWPGSCVFPDFARTAVRAWWGDWYRVLLDAGIAGVLNDMNEPAVHDRPMDAPGSDRIDPPLDAEHGEGDERTTHAEIHNVYALLEARAAHHAMRRLRPDERTLLVTRAGFAGIQAHAVVWTGDNASYWEHLEMSLPQLLNLGVSGVPLAGADVGGFFADCGPELLVRWMQVGAFYPLMRSNNASGCVAQEPWAWGPAVEARCRRAIELRYRLLPYLYTCVAEAHRTGAPILRPLWWHHGDDPEAQVRDDEALVGRDLLVAPILRPGRTHREVYLPEGTWHEWRTGDVHRGPAHVLVAAGLDDDPPVFARGGSIVPVGPVMQWSDEHAVEPLTLEVYPDEAGQAEGSLYEDDGHSYGHEQGEWSLTQYRCDAWIVSAARSGEWHPAPRRTELRVHATTGVHVIDVDDDGSWEVEWRAPPGSTGLR